MRRGLDWDATAYHAASTPQRAWGRVLMASRAWRGDEVVLDAGCGTGALAREILGLVPRGRLIALDSDAGMVQAAREALKPFGERALVLQHDLGHLPQLGPVDVVFSNAVFHWVPDHEALFRGLFAVLRPGGDLLAQFGGAGNIAHVVRVADDVAATSPFASSFRDWTPPWHFEDAASTSARLAAAGFEEIQAELRPAPVRFDDAASFTGFIRTAPILPYLTQLKAPDAQRRFLDAFVSAYERAGHAWELDYVRLTIRARRPAR